MNNADIDMLEAESRANDTVALLRMILAGQVRINERLDEIQRTVNPVKWDKDHPKLEDDIIEDMF
jgi:hypothetical protein